MDCWEFKKCGREADGFNSKKFDICPAYPDDGKHSARIAGTLCSGEVKGTFDKKLVNCMKCDFYNHESFDRVYTVLDINYSC